MTTTSKTDIEIINTPTIFQVVADYSFDEKDKSLEIEWIDSELFFLKQKLVNGAMTLQKKTIAQLMDLIGKLSLRKEFIEDELSFKNYENVNDNPAWRLHKKSQSGFELKD
ncbi:hypothetical protein LV89_03345 [Arcicella aurantiaca]|uniref:Uncharacterized protein n=1 Tax=Arcicella aurantiaca TaxID=591202 RepID=A0A316E1J3_9BACT|nr:hypothetical protein [Arcicella aurantiaca]PWK22633.1 hypothetical protein LV89_03345 [Arcicella aurantiaca]